MAYKFELPIVQIINDINDKNSKSLSTPLRTDSVEVTKVATLNINTGASVIRLKTLEGSGYDVAEVDFTYTRYLTDVLLEEGFLVEGEPGDKLGLLLAQGAEQYNIPPFVIESDTDTVFFDFLKTVAEEKLEEGEWSELTVPVSFSPTSLGYVGDIDMVVTNNKAKKDLSTRVTVTDIAALSPVINGSFGKKVLNTIAIPVTVDCTAEDVAILKTVGGVITYRSQIVTRLPDALATFHYGSTASSEAQTFVNAMKTLLINATVRATSLGDSMDDPAIQVFLTPTTTDANWTGEFVLNKINVVTE